MKGKCYALTTKVIGDDGMISLIVHLFLSGPLFRSGQVSGRLRISGGPCLVGGREVTGKGFIQLTGRGAVNGRKTSPGFARSSTSRRLANSRPGPSRSGMSVGRGT